MSPAPAIMLPTAEQEQRLASSGAERKKVEAEFRTFRSELEKEMTAWEKTALDRSPPRQRQGSLVHFDFDHDTADHGPKPVAAMTQRQVRHSRRASRGRPRRSTPRSMSNSHEPAPLERDRPFTLSVWIMPGSAPQGCVASKMDSDADARGFEILWYKSQPRINLAHRYGSDGIEVVARAEIQWQPVAATRHHLRRFVEGCRV